MSDTIASLGQGAFLAAAQALLPRGPAWTRESDALLTALLSGLCDQHAALHARVAAWTEVESDPTQTSEMLDVWEAEYGLPDPCLPPNATDAQRRASLLARIVATGGQSRGYYTAVAAALGYTITITEYAPFLVGVHQVGDPLIGTEALFEWQINVSGPPPQPGPTGVPLLECLIRRLAPAHTVLRFAYSG